MSAQSSSSADIYIFQSLGTIFTIIAGWAWTAFDTLPPKIAFLLLATLFVLLTLRSEYNNGDNSSTNGNTTIVNNGNMTINIHDTESQVEERHESVSDETITSNLSSDRNLRRLSGLAESNISTKIWRELEDAREKANLELEKESRTEREKE